MAIYQAMYLTIGPREHAPDRTASAPADQNRLREPPQWRPPSCKAKVREQAWAQMSGLKGASSLSPPAALLGAFHLNLRGGPLGRCQPK